MRVPSAKKLSFLTGASLLSVVLGSCTPDRAAVLTPERSDPQQPPARHGTTKLYTPLGIIDAEWEEIGGLAITEGDIVVGRVDEMFQRSIGHQDVSRRWPNCTVNYEIDPQLSVVQADNARDAIAHWQERTGVVFAEDATAANRVSFRPNLSGICSSHVGMIGGVQSIEVGEFCGRGSLIHEIGHAVGLWHEQSRADRHAHVEVRFSNILAGKEFNFNQALADGVDIGGYDIGSIMHYGPAAFIRPGLTCTSENTSGCTIISLDAPQFYIENRVGLSEGDIAGVEQLYSGACTTAPVNPLPAPIVSEDAALATILEVLLEPEADLRVSNVVATTHAGRPGDPFEIRYNRQNVGLESAGAYRLSVRFSADDQVTVDDPEACGTLVTSQDAESNLARSIGACTVPTLPVGNYRVGVLMDATNVVSEEREDNNFALDPRPYTVSNLVLTHSPMVYGSPALLRITGAPPNVRVYFLRSATAGNGPCPSALGGLCLDLGSGAVVIGSRVSDTNGTAELSIQVPAGASATSAYLQAATAGGTSPSKSNLKRSTVTP